MLSKGVNKENQYLAVIVIELVTFGSWVWLIYHCATHCQTYFPRPIQQVKLGCRYMGFKLLVLGSWQQLRYHCSAVRHIFKTFILEDRLSSFGQKLIRVLTLKLSLTGHRLALLLKMSARALTIVRQDPFRRLSIG